MDRLTKIIIKQDLVRRMEWDIDTTKSCLNSIRLILNRVDRHELSLKLVKIIPNVIELLREIEKEIPWIKKELEAKKIEEAKWI